MDPNDGESNSTSKEMIDDKEWGRWFDLLLTFEEKHGHTYVPVKDEDGSVCKFGHWVSSQRTFYKKYEDGKIAPSALLDQRFNCLECLGGFERDSKWKNTLDEFKTHMHVHGGSIRIKTHDTKKGKQLQNWLTHQKIFYRKYKAGKIPMSPEFDERFKCIDELVGEFRGEASLDSKNKIKWEKMFKELKEYKEKHGHIYVPHQSKEYYKLSYWVHRQKQFYRLFEANKIQQKDKNYHLNYRERFRRLQELGGYNVGNITKRKRYSWEQMYQQLIKYKEEYGSVNVIKDDAVEDRFPKLEGWVRKQNRKYTNHKAGQSNITKHREMHDKRLNCLETIGLISSSQSHKAGDDSKPPTIIVDVLPSFCPAQEKTNNDDDLSSIFSDDSAFAW